MIQHRARTTASVEGIHSKANKFTTKRIHLRLQRYSAMKGLTVVEHNARRSRPSDKGFAHRTNIINKYLHLVRSRCKPTSQRRKTKL